MDERSPQTLPMYQFDIHIQAAPSATEPGEPLSLQGRSWPTVRLPEGARAHGAATFDDALAALESLPRVYTEPDGSFLWVGAGKEWQVEGNLYDRGDELAYVALKGDCPPDVFDALLRCFGWPQAVMVFQLNREGVYVDEPTFRVLAERPAK